MWFEEKNEKYDFIEFATKDEWLANRTNTIGGSDASTMVGMNKYRDEVDLWEEKILGKRNDISDKPSVRFGTYAEPYLIGLFALEHDEFDVSVGGFHFMISKEKSFMHYSSDGFLIEKDTNKKGILEIKTSTPQNKQMWEEWEERIPTQYYIQVLHGLIVTGYDFVIIKARLKTKNGAVVKEYRINRDEVQEDIEWLMNEEEDRLNKYYLPKIKPPKKISI